MKSFKIFSVCVAAVLGLTSCASSWLDQEMTGSTLTQEEYNKMSNTATGTVKGIYAMMYYCNDNHDDFGQKCIDLGSDLVSSDVAMTAQAYGWFVTDAERLTAYRTSYIWSYYFDMIMNANAVLRSLDHKQSMSTEEQGAYAQALAIRGYCYYNLANLYGPSAGDDSWQSSYGRKRKGADYDLCPIYTQNDTTEAGLVKERPLSTYKEVREFANHDLEEAINKFDECGYTRTSKLFIDKNVALGIYAYNNLQMSWVYADDNESKTKCLNNAYDAAMEVIKSNEYTILPMKDLYTTGFTDQSNASWMWGLDVTIENTTGLATFWGHVDIYTYSYAYAGATKGLDQILYASIPDNDMRKGWFNADKKYIPDSKFYDLQGKATGVIDRDWQNDDVFMRVEEMYLIAAEAKWRMGEYAGAKQAIIPLLEERIEDFNESDVSESPDDLRDLIYYNWRIEMCFEGRALMTFKRFHQDGLTQKKRGNNHFYGSGQDMKTTDYQILYIMPSSEATYNNQIND